MWFCLSAFICNRHIRLRLSQLSDTFHSSDIQELKNKQPHDVKQKQDRTEHRTDQQKPYSLTHT